MSQQEKTSQSPLEMEEEPRIVEDHNPYTEGMTEEEEIAAALRLFDIVMEKKPKH